MKRPLLALIVLSLVVCFGTNAIASIITLVPVNNGLEDLLGAGYSSASSQVATPMAAGSLDTLVYSQAFVNSCRNRIRLRLSSPQPGRSRHGYAGRDVHALSFLGSPSSVQAGYLSATATVPAGFVSGGQVPEPTGSISALSEGLLVSFYYGNRYGYQINPGDHSLAMYVTSDVAPGLISANVIDGSVATGTVVGSSPRTEHAGPADAGGLGFWLFKRYRRR